MMSASPRCFTLNALSCPGRKHVALLYHVAQPHVQACWISRCLRLLTLGLSYTTYRAQLYRVFATVAEA
jgi:hypothetical protein